MKRTLLQFGVVAAAATLFLSGCSGAPFDHFFDQAQQQGDTIPSVVTESDLDRDSSRFLGQDTKGTDYFVARTLPGEVAAPMMCLVVVGSNGEWSQGCGEALPITVGMASLGQATLFPDPLTRDRPDSPECTGVNQCVGDYLQVRLNTP